MSGRPPELAQQAGSSAHPLPPIVLSPPAPIILASPHPTASTPSHPDTKHCPHPIPSLTCIISHFCHNPPYKAQFSEQRAILVTLLVP